MDIEQSINKALNQVEFEICRSENISGSGGGSPARSDMSCHKYGKRGHIKKYYRSKVNGSSGNPPKKSTNELTEQITNKPVVSDTKDLSKSTMTHNNKQYNWCASCNNGKGTQIFNLRYVHEEW